MRIPMLVLLAFALPAAAFADAAKPQTPAQVAAEEMMVIYEDLCLTKFPNEDAFGLALAGAKAVPLPAAATTAILLGRRGTAWTVAAPHGSVVVALGMAPARSCVVTGPAAEDDGVRAVFNMLVTSFAKGHEFGTLQRPPLQQAKGDMGDATIQVIGASPDGRPRQAFVNMGVIDKDGGTQLRLTREMAPR